MVMHEITYGADEYGQECELRQEVLRKPLGRDLYAEDLGVEREQMHFGLFDDDGPLLACVVAEPFSQTEAKLRQMAVRPSRQGQGCGRLLLEGVERALAWRGFAQVHLHARLTASGFYERLGYARVGPDFFEVGLPHVQMVKSIKLER